MWPHRQQPTRLPRPWDSPGKNTGVGCHFLLQCRKVKSKSEVSQSCPTLSDPMDCSLPGSSIHGIFQARVLEWGAIAFYLVPIYTKTQINTFIYLLFLQTNNAGWRWLVGSGAAGRGGISISMLCKSTQFDRSSFFKFFKMYFIFGCAGSSWMHLDFLYLGWAKATLHCSAPASHCSDFSLWSAGSRSTGLVALQHVWSSRPRIKFMTPELPDRFLTTGPSGKSWLWFFCLPVFLFLTGYC